MTVYEKLMKVQSDLKAPKNRKNTFGNYNYRSCEDILDAVKPLLRENKATVVLSDSPIQVGDRYYIEATAIFTDLETGDFIQTRASARESEVKKGMDDSQITGTASSYARKYCLNGLFLIDDTKDADTDEYHNENKGRAAKTSAEDKKVDKNAVDALRLALKTAGKEEEAMLKYLKLNKIEDMTFGQWNEWMVKLNKEK